ncbi:MAG TPA: hypothetical protein VHU83_06270 [Bryobacteraceae bacterium]|jgi:hypothetical protein|nr:hypothetical protein [Bryobacteraceae bacterium]
MTNTMEERTERAEVVGLSDKVIAKMRERFALECKRMLEEVSEHGVCTCGRHPKSAEEHAPECPISAWREAAHAVWLWGQP